tara:strand:+ start:1534 stop:2280 length:747 start_codon:yes stop_codon:yes gene_type:complete
VFHIPANWPAPANISALTTSCLGGHSHPPFLSNNLALHVGDEAKHVEANRQQLINYFNLPTTPIWLEQTHSTICIDTEVDFQRCADASITRDTNKVLAIMTADCLPILLCDKQGLEIAAIHAGWRGLLDGVIEQTLSKMQSLNQNILAWIGPAICGNCFEVGSEVYQLFARKNLILDDIDSLQSATKRYLNLPGIAQKILNNHGVLQTFNANICTFEQSHHFYSYRRQAQTGRMTSLIWFNHTTKGQL